MQSFKLAFKNAYNILMNLSNNMNIFWEIETIITKPKELEELSGL